MPLWAVIPAAGLGTRMAENAVLGCKELVKSQWNNDVGTYHPRTRKLRFQHIVVVSSPNKPAIDEAMESRRQNRPSG